MAHYQTAFEPILEADDSTIYTAMTPPSTVAGDVNEKTPLGGTNPSSSSVPWPGSTFIIRSASSGEVLTLLDGQVVLARPGGPGSIHWQCIENKGWLGFKNPVSGKFLGHNKEGYLWCCVDHHKPWEHFCVRMTPEGGYVLMMTHFERLWHVGIKKESGKQKLAKIKDGAAGGITWEFVKI